MKREILAIVACVIGCCTAFAGEKPTATEAFHLRTECARMEREIYKEFYSKRFPPLVGSRYDENTNRCFVGLANANKNGAMLILFDGQTKKAIASCGIIDGEDISSIGDRTVSKDEACAFINKIMKHD